MQAQAPPLQHWAWLWRMYRDGPGYLGGWLGLSDAELCARLAPGTQAMDWVVQVEGPTPVHFGAGQRCKDLIDRAFTGYTLSIQVGIMVALLVVTWKFLGHVCACAWWCLRTRHRARGRRGKHTQQAAVVSRAQQVPHAWRKRVGGQGAHSFQCACKCPVHDIDLDHGPVCDICYGHHFHSDGNGHEGTHDQQQPKQHHKTL